MAFEARLKGSASSIERNIGFKIEKLIKDKMQVVYRFDHSLQALALCKNTIKD